MEFALVALLEEEAAGLVIVADIEKMSVSASAVVSKGEYGSNGPGVVPQ